MGTHQSTPVWEAHWNGDPLIYTVDPKPYIHRDKQDIKTWLSLRVCVRGECVCVGV